MLILYVKTKCSFSQFAMEMVKQSQLDYKLIIVDDVDEWKMMKDKLSSYLNMTITTVPQAFWQDPLTQKIMYIGDSADLRQWLTNVDVSQ